MARRLLLLRHAKALPPEHGMADRDRPLAPRGHKDAALMAPAVRDAAPDLVLCSPSRRTRETLAGLTDSGISEESVSFVPNIYDAAGDYLDIIAREADEAGTVLLIGHNPTIQMTALTLTGSGDRAAADSLASKFPTCGLAIFDLDIAGWRALKPGAGRLQSFLIPRDFGGGGSGD